MTKDQVWYLRGNLYGTDKNLSLPYEMIADLLCNSLMPWNKKKTIRRWMKPGRRNEEPRFPHTGLPVPPTPAIYSQIVTVTRDTWYISQQSLPGPYYSRNNIRLCQNQKEKHSLVLVQGTAFLLPWNGSPLLLVPRFSSPMIRNKHTHNISSPKSRTRLPSPIKFGNTAVVIFRTTNDHKCPLLC